MGKQIEPIKQENLLKRFSHERWYEIGGIA